MPPPETNASSPESIEPILAESVEAPIADFAAPETHHADVYGVPRRFGIGTIMVITAAFGLLLTLLQAMGAYPSVIAFVVVFVSFVGTAQMLLFRGQQPRRASVVAGVVCLPLMTVCAAVLSGSRGPRSGLACFLAASVLFGGGFGYLAGGIVAGVFLVMDAVERGLRELRGQPLDDERPDAS